MGNDSFTETSSQSWFSRLGGAFKGILVGIVLFLVAFPLLFWNEGRAVKRYKTLKEGSGAVVSASADSVDPGNDGKLVHVSGPAETTAQLTDSEFGVDVNAIKLRRTVEMYQWVESVETKKKKKLGGGTETTRTYNYKKEWSEKLYPSTDFKKPDGHENPKDMAVNSTTQVADEVTVGAYKLSPSLVRSINTFERLPVKDDNLTPTGITKKVVRHKDGYYVGDDPSNPQVGDLRITFRVVKPCTVSLVAGQVKDTFEPYATEAGGTIELLQVGTHSAAAMFKAAQDSNKTMTWILRFVGFAVMTAGLAMILSPLSVLADIIPFVGGIVATGTLIISLGVSLALSLATISVAWIFYRPMLAIALLAVVAVVAVLLVMKQKGAKASAGGATPVS